MRVSKDWHELIKSSPQLRDAQVLKALPSSLPVTGKCSDTRPHYTDSEEIWVNPKFRRFAEKIGAWREHWVFGSGKEPQVVDVEMDVEDVDRLDPLREQFTTLPPCNRMSMVCGDFDVEHYACEIYVRSGIRVRDLIEVVRAIQRSHRANIEGMARELGNWPTVLVVEIGFTQELV